jgi:predicted lipid-binding transport protein (Tim44 family)
VIRRLSAALLLLLAAAAEAFARAGGGGGFHGGGGFSGGGYSGGGFSSGGSSGGGGDVIGWIIYAYIRLLIAHPFIMIPLTAYAIWLYSRFHGELWSASSASSGSSVEREPPIAQEVHSAQAGVRGAALAALRARDPGFDEAAFLKRAAGAFLVVQDAWSNQDMSKARAFVSDGVFERFTRQIAEQKARGVRNRMTNVNVLGCSALHYLAGPHFDSVYVSVRASADDAMVALEDGRVISSDDGAFEEVWTFLRRPGAKTLARPGLLEGHCPSCGAPLEIADAAQCAACKAWVNSGEHDWVLVTITQESEWAYPNPERDVSGWEAMRAKDPELSLESLEDRASVAFWRWLDARRRQDPAPLRGVSSDDFLKALAFDGSFERDGAVGAVEVMAFEPGKDFDRAHVQVRWEAERFESSGGEPSSVGRQLKTHFFVFLRKAGASSDPKAGLRTSRCPSCGAPPAEADAAACAYCGHAFNDGSRQWVLVEILPFGEWRRPSA